MTISEYISAHWVQWVFAAAVAALGWGNRKLTARIKAEQERNEAIAEGMQSLLRESIVDNSNKYADSSYYRNSYSLTYYNSYNNSWFEYS
jgi:hypothetical protein